MDQAFIYKKELFNLVNTRELFAENDYNFAGRPPLNCDFVYLPTNKEISIINLHYKCCGNGVWRRQKASKMLHKYVSNQIEKNDVQYIILGDWNDDLKDVVTGDEHCFTPFLLDDRFFFPTAKIAGDLSQASYPKEPYYSFLDHILVSKSLLDNPEKYVDSNIIAFANILNFFKNKKTKKIFYASSSSVYGEVKKFPSKESSQLNPKNIYAFSKVVNENLANFYSEKYKIKIIGLRFFTCYGEWGRPDMFLFKLFKSIETKKYLNLNNYGNHYRDFTYIEDVLKIISKLIKSNLKKHEIFNVCSNKPLNILKITNLFKNKGLKIRKIKKHPADVYKTHGDNKKVLKITKNINFTNPFNAILNTYKWYKSKKIIKKI